MKKMVVVFMLIATAAFAEWHRESEIDLLTGREERVIFSFPSEVSGPDSNAYLVFGEYAGETYLMFTLGGLKMQRGSNTVMARIGDDVYTFHVEVTSDREALIFTETFGIVATMASSSVFVVRVPLEGGRTLTALWSLEGFSGALAWATEHFN